MEENKDNKDNKEKLSGKLQLKKTINAGQIKQSFSHGRSKSVSVEVKRKRSLSRFNKNELIEPIKSPTSELDDIKVTRNEEGFEDNQNNNEKKVKDNNENITKENFKKPPSKTFNENKESDEVKKEINEKSKQPKFTKAAKSFENFPGIR